MSSNKTFQERAADLDKKSISILLSAANADGKVHKDEFTFLIEKAKEKGLSEKEVDEILKDPQRYFNDDVKPATPEKKKEFVFDLFSMIFADGVIYESEMKFALKMLVDMEIEPEILHEVLISAFDSTIKEIEDLSIPDRIDVEQLSKDLVDIFEKTLK
jgi:uncharacterized tellurite resistance protein B-like protein